jgi:Glycosyltransferase family 87
LLGRRLVGLRLVARPESGDWSSGTRWRRIALLFAFGCLALGVAIIVATFVHFLAQGYVAWDAPTYLAAGERLNAGHNLYALGPGDRAVYIDPPFWTVPLLSPPPIAVLWRPIALLGNTGILIWWGVCIASIVGSVVAVCVRAPRIGGPAVLVLAVPLAWELGTANVNGLLFAGFIAVWLLSRAGRDQAAGVVVAVMASLKVWPALFVLWFIARRRGTAVSAFVLAATAIAIGSVLFAGLGSNLMYLQIGAAIKPSPGSIAGWLLSAGIDIPWIGYVIAVVAVAAVVAFRRYAGITFTITVAAIVLASPAVYINSFALLFTALAPVVWPLSVGRQADRTSGDVPAKEPSTIGWLRARTTTPIVRY